MSMGVLFFWQHLELWGTRVAVIPMAVWSGVFMLWSVGNEDVAWTKLCSAQPEEAEIWCYYVVGDTGWNMKIIHSIALCTINSNIFCHFKFAFTFAVFDRPIFFLIYFSISPLDLHNWCMRTALWRLSKGQQLQESSRGALIPRLMVKVNDTSRWRYGTSRFLHVCPLFCCCSVIFIMAEAELMGHLFVISS